MNATWMKLVAILLFIAAITGTTWFASKAHYVGQFDALKAEIQQAAKDEQKANDAITTKDNYVTKEVYNEAQTKLAGASTTIDDLNSRLRLNPVIVTRKVSSSTSCTNQPGQQANGSTTTTGNSQPTSVTESTIDTNTLKDVLQTGIDALNAELLWRQWNNGVTR